jgi:PTS system galactitol-specific IIC component
MEVIQYVLNLGIGVMMPFVIFVLSLIFRVKVSSAIRSSLLVGVALIAINMVIGFLMSNLGPVTAGLVERTGLNLTIIDVGWPAAASITWASPVAAFFIPVGIIINLILLVTQITKTVDVDLWNYWVFGFSGAIVTYITNNIIFGIIAFIITEIVILVIADKTAKTVQEFFDLPKISIPHGNAAPFALLAYPLEFIFERIPGFNKLKADSESIRIKFGVLGEPVVIGIIVGVLLSLLAGFDIPQILNTSMSLAAAMVVLPKVTRILMEGLLPLSEAAGVFLQKRFPGKDFYIGLDTAITVGSSEVLATGLVLIPISILLAFIVPGNKLMPVADIVGLPFIVSLAVPIFKGNVIRSIIGGTIICFICLLIGTNMAPIFTNMAGTSGMQVPEGATQVVSYLGGTSPITWVLAKIAELF